MQGILRKISRLRYLAPLFGLIQYAALSDAIGQAYTPTLGRRVGLVAGFFFAVWFWVLMTHGRKQIVADHVIHCIVGSLNEVGVNEHRVELSSGPLGMLARVYVVGCRSRMEQVHDVIARDLRDAHLKQYLWVLQLSNLNDPSDVAEERRKLNEELERVLRQQGSGRKTR